METFISVITLLLWIWLIEQAKELQINRTSIKNALLKIRHALILLAMHWRIYLHSIKYATYFIIGYIAVASIDTLSAFPAIILLHPEHLIIIR